MSKAPGGASTRIRIVAGAQNWIKVVDMQKETQMRVHRSKTKTQKYVNLTRIKAHKSK
jgi:hypothetical protein